jgi:hypothetical protein
VNGKRAIGIAAFTVALLAVPAPATAQGGAGHRVVRTDGWLDPYADGDSVYVPAASAVDTVPSEGRGAGSSVAYEEKRTPMRFCGTLDARGAAKPCVDGVTSGEATRLCADGSAALAPLQRRAVDPTTHVALGPWTQVDAGGCPEDPVAAVTLSVEDFQRLPLTPSGPSYQPADGRGLVNMPLIVFTDASAQRLQTVVLGVPVTVRATPVSFAWDFGDGSDPLETTDPGAPYPHHTVSHTYLTAGSYTVSLSTTWRGEFQVNGQGPWLPVTGTARTSSTPFVETVEAAPSHLVADPLPAP